MREASTTPLAISPTLSGITNPPDDFFDLLLIDEAHHAPAKTWEAILAAFPKARKALFTATPFRRDKKEIKGTIVFRYPLSEARKEKIFGKISFVPVRPLPKEDPDVAIAKQVENALVEDRAAGYAHSILVRVDSKNRGKELAEKYERETKLKLCLIHSGMTAKFVRATIDRMRKGALDGVICVNMLGEGFDFPNLKIAALHTPHRSLGVTLQFIGRFARTGDETLGPARFFAIPQEIEGETRKLFSDDGESWDELVIGLAEGRASDEEKLRRDLETFKPAVVVEPTLTDLSLYALRPGYHVKVYQVPEGVDISQPPTLPKPFEVSYWRVSEELATAVVITSQRSRPKWTDQARFGQLRYELFVIFYDSEANLLFICASRKGNALYRHIGAEYAGNATKILPLYKINRVLSGLTDVKCHNLGMRCRLRASRNETYRIKAGSNTGNSVQKVDGKLFHRGHVACTAVDGTKPINLGYSSASKIWSMGSGTVPELVEWCKSLSAKIIKEQPTIPIRGLEHLSVGEPLKSIPANVLAVDWDEEVYAGDIEISFLNSAGERVTKRLLDVDLSIDRASCDGTRLTVIAACDEESWTMEFTPFGAPFFTFKPALKEDPTVEDDETPMSLAEFLNEYPLHFYFADFSRLRGEEWFPCNHKAELFNKEQILAVDWKAGAVNIRKEFWKPTETRDSVSIHEYLETVLLAEAKNEIVFYDHRTGEVADFLTVEVGSTEIVIALYHCKKSGGANPGDRVDDVYDVCGQATKSFNMIENPEDLLKHAKRRSADGSVFRRGDYMKLESLLRDSHRRIAFRLVVVQPGISLSKISDDSLSVLAAANEFIHQLGAMDLAVMGSE